MADDQQVLIGKWTVWVKNWIWEYEFFPNGTVAWRDTRSLEKGTGRWSMSPKLVNLSWSDSATKESWQLPLSPLATKRTWYSSHYFTGAYQIEKVVFKTEQPAPLRGDEQFWMGEGPQSHSDYIDNLCTHVAFGIYIGGFWVYVPESYSPHPIEIPANLLWFEYTGQPITDTIYDSQALANNATGGANPNKFAYYEGVGGKITCPTAFTLKTAPTIVNTASLVVDELIAQVKEELKDILTMLVLRVAVSTAGAAISRNVEVRRLKARDARAKAALETRRMSNSKTAPVGTSVPVKPLRPYVNLNPKATNAENGLGAWLDAEGQGGRLGLIKRVRGMPESGTTGVRSGDYHLFTTDVENAELGNISKQHDLRGDAVIATGKDIDGIIGNNVGSKSGSQADVVFIEIGAGNSANITDEQVRAWKVVDINRQFPRLRRLVVVRNSGGARRSLLDLEVR